MNRIFATLTLAALALSSCIKENDSYKDLLPVQPGQYIYSYVTTQDRVAMQAANAGMRWPCWLPRSPNSAGMPKRRPRR